VVVAYGVQRHFQQYFSYIVAVSFICGGNRRTQKYNIVKTASKSNRKTVERGKTDIIKHTYR
jgi:hypothetical protein